MPDKKNLKNLQNRSRIKNLRTKSTKKSNQAIRGSGYASVKSIKVTKSLEKVVKRISKLPDIEQDEIARFILEEIEDDKKWEENFKNSQNELSILADEALKELNKGKTKSFGY